MTAAANPPRRRRRLTVTLAVLLVLVALVTGGAVLLGSKLRSPEQAAADAAPPSPSVVTATATRRKLTEPVVLRGRLEPGRSVKVMPPASATGPNSVVTKVLSAPGERATEGRVVLELAGEPMFLLDLPFPLYRDVQAGMRGPDVRELQLALRRTGYPVGVSGVFDAQTRQRVGQFYRDRGYRASVADEGPQVGGGSAGDGTGAAGVDRKPDAAQSRTNVGSPGGPVIRQSAVLVLDRVGRRISRVHARVGQILTEADRPVLELDGESPTIVAVVDRDQARLLRPDQEAVVTDDATGTQARSTIKSVGDQPVTDPQGQGGFEVQLQFTDKAMTDAAGRALRIDVQLAAGAADVLAVPVSAVYSRADGSTFVTVVRPGVSPTDVTVTTGQSAGGWVEIREPVARTLTDGVEVAVGERTNR